MDKCLRCGNCCINIFMHKDFFGREANKKTIEFVKKNFVVVMEMPDGNYYDCKLLDKDNKRCTDYDNRLEICSGFPFYGRNFITIVELKKLRNNQCGYLTEEGRKK